MTATEGQKLTLSGHITNVVHDPTRWPAGEQSPWRDVRVKAQFDHEGRSVTLEFTWPRDRALPQVDAAVTLAIEGDWPLTR